jgi:hypothetical protein
MDLKYSRAFSIIFYCKLVGEKSYKRRSTPHLQIRSSSGERSPRRPKTLSFSGRREEELLVKECLSCWVVDHIYARAATSFSAGIFLLFQGCYIFLWVVLGY